MNHLLSDPHRRDVIMGQRDDEYLIRLFATAQPDGQVKLVRYRLVRIARTEVDGRRVLVRDDHEPTFSPDEAAVIASGSVRFDGVTTLHVEAVVDSKEAVWRLLAAVEHGRRECAVEMGSAYMDRFEYGMEKKR